MDPGAFRKVMESEGEPVATVDPADLLSVWRMQHEATAAVGGEQVAISWQHYERKCHPGSDTRAVWYRASMLALMAGPMKMLSAWMSDGEPNQAVFSVFASFPMTTMGVGVPRSQLPFDLPGLLAEIEKASSSSSHQ